MNKKVIPHIILLVFVFSLIGCKETRPENVIPEAEMENLLYDYHIAKSLGEDLSFNENYKKAIYINAVFNKHGITEAEFDSSMIWYTRHADELSKIYDNVSVRFKSKQTVINQLIAIRDKKPMTSEAGDSIDVWAWKRIAHLSNHSFNNNFKFVLPSDSNFKERDEIVWKANFHFANKLKSDSSYLPLMAMQIVYDNDSIISNLINVNKNGFNELRLSSDTLGKIREVKGFIYIPSEQQDVNLMINEISMHRYHNNDTLKLNIDSISNGIISSDNDTIKEAIKVLDKAASSNSISTDVKELKSPESNRVRTRTTEILREEEIVKPKPIMKKDNNNQQEEVILE